MFQTFPISGSYIDFNQPQAVPSAYGIGDSRTGKFFMLEGNREGTFFIEEENLNEEILKLAEKSGSFDFLAKDEEDGYTFEDGEAIC